MKLTQEQFNTISEIMGDGFADSCEQDARSNNSHKLSLVFLSSAIGYTLGLLHGAEAFQELTDEEIENSKKIFRAMNYLFEIDRLHQEKPQ